MERPAYRFLFETMANLDTERPGLLHHCAGGKDRTGVGAALMLKLLGVPDSVIIEDNRRLA
ncbi:tyrosine-protein phosphatase [Paenibacillus sp. FSL L8-0463]|uniref:tyrosine-protein phosphatase n=1 Tax=Paenibacillus sp. FSL L8-0463 TaxID=2954687 RepID=UPI0031196E31